MTAITVSGTYPGGTYDLAANIVAPVNNSLTYEGLLTFTGPFTLRLNGFEVKGTGGPGSASAPNLSVGVMSAYQGKIEGPGKISGCRVGVKLDGAGSVVIGIDASDNLYTGLWLRGDGSKATHNLIERIGGVTDSPYATGIQLNGDDCEVAFNTFGEIYRQTGYSGSAPGEGVCINATTGTLRPHIHDNLFYNSEARLNTYALFAGAESAKVLDNNARNFWRGFMMSDDGAPEARRNMAFLESPLLGSGGIGCEVADSGAVTHNLAIGYEAPFPGSTPVAHNVALTFPGWPETDFGTVFEQSLASSFGNVNGQTLRVTLACTALDLPPGPVSTIRVHLRGHADEPHVIDKMYVGHSLGGGNGTSLVALRVNGATGWTIPAGQLVVAEASFAYNKTSDLLFSSFHDGGAGADKAAAQSSFAGASTFNKYGDQAAQASVSGLTQYSGYLSLIEKIELDGF